MKVIVYGKPMENAILGFAHEGLSGAGHRALFRNPRLFQPGDVEKGDIILVESDGSNTDEIIETYARRGQGVYALGFQNPSPAIGYPVASFEEPALLAEPFSWGRLSTEIPDAYQNAPLHTLTLFYVAAAIVAENEAPLQDLTPKLLAAELRGNAFSEAPRVIVVGGGKSLKNFDWNLLEGEVVIAANRSFERPHVGMCMSVDDRFYRWLANGELGEEARRNWRDFRGMKVFSPLPDRQGRIEDCFDWPRVDEKVSPDFFPPTTHGCGHSCNSGYAAMLLAWAYGAKEICLLGIDLKAKKGTAQTQEWHHDPHPHNGTDAQTYADMANQFNSAAPAMKEAGIKVLQFGDTALRCFRRAGLGALKAHLNPKPVRPVVVSYYTNDRYKRHAEAMARSAAVFGLKSDLRKQPDLGSWHLNTCQKATVIEDALRSIDGPMVFVDADARFRRYPTAFDTFFGEAKEDLLLSWFDWDEFPRDRRTGSELSSAVMGLRPSDAVYSLLREWQDLNLARRDKPEIWEQRTLQELVEEKNIPHAKLPMSHNQIADSMAALGVPVIEQLQASREERR